MSRVRNVVVAILVLAAGAVGLFFGGRRRSRN